jgi:hypothetical protein
LDLKTSTLFGNETASLTPPTKRILESKHLGNRLTYINKKLKFLEDRRWFDRLEEVKNGPHLETEIAHLLEQLDRDWTRASLHAEKQCTRYKQPPYVQRLDALRKQKKVLVVCSLIKATGLTSFHLSTLFWLAFTCSAAACDFSFQEKAVKI